MCIIIPARLFFAQISFTPAKLLLYDGDIYNIVQMFVD